MRTRAHTHVCKHLRIHPTSHELYEGTYIYVRREKSPTVMNANSSIMISSIFSLERVTVSTVLFGKHAHRLLCEGNLSPPEATNQPVCGRVLRRLR